MAHHATSLAHSPARRSLILVTPSAPQSVLQPHKDHSQSQALQKSRYVLAHAPALSALRLPRPRRWVTLPLTTNMTTFLASLTEHSLVNIEVHESVMSPRGPQFKVIDRHLHVTNSFSGIFIRNLAICVESAINQRPQNFLRSCAFAMANITWIPFAFPLNELQNFFAIAVQMRQ